MRHSEVWRRTDSGRCSPSMRAGSCCAPGAAPSGGVVSGDRGRGSAAPGCDGPGRRAGRLERRGPPRVRAAAEPAGPARCRSGTRGAGVADPLRGVRSAAVVRDRDKRAGRRPWSSRRRAERLHEGVVPAAVHDQRPCSLAHHRRDRRDAATPPPTGDGGGAWHQCAPDQPPHTAWTPALILQPRRDWAHRGEPRVTVIAVCCRRRSRIQAAAVGGARTAGRYVNFT